MQDAEKNPKNFLSSCPKSPDEAPLSPTPATARRRNTAHVLPYKNLMIWLWLLPQSLRMHGCVRVMPDVLVLHRRHVRTPPHMHCYRCPSGMRSQRSASHATQPQQESSPRAQRQPFLLHHQIIHRQTTSYPVHCALRYPYNLWTPLPSPPELRDS